MKSDFKKAIELGQEWMKKSKDSLHDFEHAYDVEKHALEICKTECITDERFVSLLRIACWWHDSYKAVHPQWPMITYFTEGVFAGKITYENLENILSPDDLMEVYHAVRYHNSSPISLFFTHRYLGVTRILIEADNLDCFNDMRFKRKYAKPNFVMMVLNRIYLFYIKHFYSLLPMYSYTKKNLLFSKIKNG